MSEPSNQDRANRIDQLLALYKDLIGDDPDSVITDLLVDLRHYCKQQDIDFDAENSTAAMHFEHESSEYERE